jgi:hypothetical protein
MLFTLSLCLFLYCAQAQTDSLSCWGWQENADYPKQEFTCPQADHWCIRYYDKVEEATFATCVPKEKCEFMEANEAVWEDVLCCDTNLCNDPDAGTVY